MLRLQSDNHSAIIVSMTSETLHTRDGRAFTGTVRTDDKGRPYFTQRKRCSRCGGAGGSDMWIPTGRTCYGCGGAGHRGNETVRLYTAAQIEKLDAAAAKRTAKRDAAAAAKAALEQAAADARRQAFDAQYGALLARVAPHLDVEPIAADIYQRATHTASLTDKQAAFLTLICDRRDAKAQEAAGSAWLDAAVGARIEVPVTVARIASYERAPFRSYGRYMETVWIVTMVDAAGRQIVSKSPRFTAEAGQAFTLRATVKEKSTYQDVKQTVVTRAART